MIKRQTFKVENVVLGGQTLVSMDHMKIPFQASLNIDIVSGTANYAVEYTTDDIYGTVDPATFRWLPLPDFPSGSTSSTIKNLNTAVTAIRMNLQSLTGEMRFTVIQGVGV